MVTEVVQASLQIASYGHVWLGDFRVWTTLITVVCRPDQPLCLGISAASVVEWLLELHAFRQLAILLFLR